MLSKKDFIQMSLELNLFFGRIMKEHMIFMETGFLVKNSNLILEADQLKKSFEEILVETVALSNGVISQESIDSNEFITSFTLEAENITESLTGVCIDQDITLAELELTSNPDSNYPSNLEKQVFDLNNRAINLVIEVIKFKENVLNKLLDCNIYAALYPSLIEHILGEAKLYLQMLKDLQNRIKPKDNIFEQEIFWDTIMEEHVLFIRGLLDPTEKELIDASNNFANIFEDLIEKTKEATEKDLPKIIKKTLEATTEVRDFKAAATKGIIDCKIKSILTPLLGDHVLREANHYVRILKSYIEDC